MRVGILGAGAMGMTHAAAWPATPAEVVGVVAKTPELARPLAECYPCRVYPSLEALLPDVDIVDVCTPTYLHHEMVLQAAAAGKHVICEKPLARAVTQGQEMIAACRKAGVKLFVGHVVRFFPEYSLAKQIVDSGRIGKPAVVRLSRYVFQPRKADDNWFVDFEKSGGMMMDLMIHDFDYARWVAGDVKTVDAKNILSQAPDAAVDHGLAILTHTSGTLSHVEGSWAYPPPTFRTMFEIACERAGVILMTAFPMRFSPVMLEVKALLGRDGMGKVYAVSSANNGQMPARHRAWFVDKELAGGGAGMDHIVHLADLLRWCLRSEVKTVYARFNRILHADKVDVETGGLVMLTLDNGACATIDCSWSRPLGYPIWGGLAMELIGERGVVTADGFHQNLINYGDENTLTTWLPWGSDANRGMVEEFVAAIREGRSPAVTGEDGLKAVEIVMAAYRSAETGQVVTLRG